MGHKYRDYNKHNQVYQWDGAFEFKNLLAKNIENLYSYRYP